MRQWKCLPPLLLLLLLGLAPEAVRAEANHSRESVLAAAESLGLLADRRPHLSGVRVETLKNGEDTFVGYTEDGVSVVHPDAEVRVRIFGYWLDQITHVAFTPRNCSDAPTSLQYADFALQTHLERRIELEATFPEFEGDYKLCIRYRLKDTGESTPYIQINDEKTWVTTELPPRTYYLPLFLQIAFIGFLLVLSGFFSGINLGLMSLQPKELELIMKSGSPAEARYAETILPVRRQGNFLLCSQLISNVVVNSAISILMDDLTSGLLALIVSSFAIVVFAEIVPQSICVKKGLAVGAYTIWVTRFFMILTCPLSWPIGKILDCIVGEEVTVYSRKRLMEMMIMANPSDGGHFSEELKMAIGAMQLSDKTVRDVMTKINDVFMLSDAKVLNTRTVAEILKKGFTRIPVYSGERNNIVAMLNVKDLALLDPDDNFTVSTVCRYNEHPVRFVMDETPLRMMLEEFKKGAYHLAMVQRLAESTEGDPHYQLTGVVTLEDILEEILQAEIMDETDAVTDNVQRAHRLDVQARDLTRILEIDSAIMANISMQLRLAAVQWLTANQPALHPNLIAHNILERLVRQNVHMIDFGNRSRNSTLFTKDQLSERFILILEGRVQVSIGKHEMHFEAGPWHCFGEEMLNKLMEIAPGLVQYGLSTNTGSCSALSSSQRSLSGRHQAAFAPDFTAIARDECVYLEITSEAYLQAYHATLMTKENKRHSLRPAVSLIEDRERRQSFHSNEGSLKDIVENLANEADNKDKVVAVNGGKKIFVVGSGTENNAFVPITVTEADVEVRKEPTQEEK
uniref:CNNM transmembrane domain-containing protein n=1 Tax=Plectus sambesii TaxID=2011161 RepID=A0A914WFY6_9BILA